MTRRQAAAVAAAAMTGLLSACGSGHQVATRGALAQSMGLDVSACDPSVIAGAGPAIMPAPRRLDAVETFDQAQVTLRPPTPADVASVPAAQAWDGSGGGKRGDVRYEIVLARLSAEFPATMGAGNATSPLYDGRLVWAVISRGVPMSDLGGSSLRSPAASPPRCYAADALHFTDAATGESLVSMIFGHDR